MTVSPKKGLQGLIENWQSDLIAAISVALVALPLGLGIALASGVQPISGVFSAIIGGIVTTFFRGSNVTINGPTAGLIAVILLSISVLDDGSGQTLNYVFAAIVVSGGLQIALGLFKLGKFADLFHSTVIHGILAAIGVIIFAKQLPLALGIHIDEDNTVEALIAIIKHLPDTNPYVAIISLSGLLLILFHSRISYKLFHFLPAPMWVLLLSIPFVYLFDFMDYHSAIFLGNSYELGPHLLIDIPDNILDAIMFPDFSRINSLPFWSSVISITLIASIESLACAKAIDKLDPYNRKTDMNKDLIGIGISTMVSGMIGGLPIINVIVRSSVNVHHNAKTKWSNFYHGLILIIIVFLLAPIIQMVPLAALAILLVFTGYKLASPKVFKHVYSQGIEQLAFFIGTLVITMFTDLMIGILGGLSLALAAHILLAKVPLKSFFYLQFRVPTKLIKKKDGTYLVRIRGIANFIKTVEIDKILKKIRPGSKVKIELSEARIIGLSIMEHLYDFQRDHSLTGGEVEMSGLANHSSSSTHPMGLKVLNSPYYKLNGRQKKVKKLAIEKGWGYKSDNPDQIDFIKSFYFFHARPIKSVLSTISCEEWEKNVELCDICFEEGALLVYEEFKTTVGLLRFPFSIPKFTIQKMALYEKYLHLEDHKDIDYVIYHNFPKQFNVKVDSIEEMDAFVNQAFCDLIEQSDIITHIESNGNAILLFTNNLRLAKLNDMQKFIDFARELKMIAHLSHSEKKGL